MTPSTMPFSVARDTICRRINDAKSYSAALNVDISSLDVGRIGVQDRALWAGWQRVQSSHLGRAQRRSTQVAFSTGAVLLAFGLTYGSGTSLAAFAMILAVIVTIAACLVVAVLEGELARQPGYLRWSTRTRLDRRVRQRVDLQPLRSSLDDELECGDLAHEARLVIVAIEIATSIQCSPMWGTGYLDRQHCRYDVRAELAVLSRHAINLYRRRTSGDDRQKFSDGLDQRRAWAALVLRVTLLYQYQVQLDRLIRQADLVQCHPGPTGQASPSATILAEMRWIVTLLHETDMPTQQQYSA